MGRLEVNMRGISEVYERNMRGTWEEYVSNIIPIIGIGDELEISYMKTEGIKGDGFLRASVGYVRIMMGYWEIVMDKAVRK